MKTPARKAKPVNYPAQLATLVTAEVYDYIEKLADAETEAQERKVSKGEVVRVLLDAGIIRHKALAEGVDFTAASP